MAKFHTASAAAPPEILTDSGLLAAALIALELPVLVIAHGQDTAEPMIVHANDAFTAWTGRAIDRHSDMPFSALIGPDDICIVQPLLLTVLRDYMPKQCDTLLRLRNGDMCTVTLSFSPMPVGSDEQAGMRHAVCLIRESGPVDISGRRKLLGLEDIIQPLQEIVTTLTEGIVLFDHYDRLVFCNQRILEMYPDRAHLYRRGARREDLLRASAADEEFQIDGQSIMEFVEKGRRQVIDADAEREIQLRDGRIIRISRRQTANGRLAIHTDVTEQKRAYKLLSDAVEAMNEGFALYGPDDRIVVCNRRLGAIHPEIADILRPGTSFTEILRKTMNAGAWTATPEDLDAYIAHRVRRRREIGTNVTERSRADGGWLRISGKLLADGHYLAIHTDITEQKRRELDLYNAKQNAELANQAKSGFLANVSHELRTPLNAIIGFSEVMCGEMFGPLGNVRYVDYMNDVHSSAHHLLDLINDLLDMSKIEAGKFTLHDEYFDFAPLVEACLRQLEPQRAGGELEIAANIAGDLPKLRADNRSIRQVMINLLSNAIKFTQPGGNVRVDARTDAGAFVITVSDNGIGIRPDDLEQLATPFQQVGEPMSRTTMGTGLGLSISRSLIELHGGTLHIASTFGVGTTVTFTLPPSRNADEAY